MNIEGKVRKRGTHWIIEIPLLDLMTQANDKKDVAAMAKDAIECLIDDPTFSVVVHTIGNKILIDSQSPKSLMALALKRQRARREMSQLEVARKLGAKSVNEYSQYEQGRAQPSLQKFSELMIAIDSSRVPVLTYEKT